MNISILCVFVIAITILSVGAYDINNKCSHDRVTADYFNIHPEEKMEHLAIRKRMLDVAKDYVKSMSIHDRSKSIMEVTTVQIPVVWHVLYTPDIPSTFITKAQIDQEMIWLNDWYSAQNVNFDTASSLWSSDIAQAEDFGIQFVLATRDPNGDNTDGIEYRETSVGDTCGDTEIFLTSQGGLDIWNPIDYMNLYTCNIPDLGYAYIPTSNTHYRDGVVLRHDQLGDSFYSGSTISHEVGHWLGLYHTFAQGACEDDDFIDDTPNTDLPATSYTNYGTSCPGQNGATDDDFIRCGNIIMVQNNMDYNYEPCLAFFTKEQVAVMRAYLTENTVRGSLGTSDGLNPNCGSYDCDDKTCGDDGCGGVCGDCSINSSFKLCDVDECVAPCPNIDCIDKNCGADGCGGVCGTCTNNQECNNDQLCESPNDNCNEAITVDVTTSTQNYLAGNELSSGTISCDGNTVGGPIWYTFNALTNGQLTVDTIGSLFDTTLAVFRGSCGSLNCVGFNDDINSDLVSSLTISFQSGQTYFIVVGGYTEYGNTQRGPLQLNVLSNVDNPEALSITPTPSVTPDPSNTPTVTRTPSSSVTRGASPSKTPSNTRTPSISDNGPNPSATRTPSTIEVPSTEPETPRPSIPASASSVVVSASPSNLPSDDPNSVTPSRSVSSTRSRSNTAVDNSSDTSDTSYSSYSSYTSYSSDTSDSTFSSFTSNTSGDNSSNNDDDSGSISNKTVALWTIIVVVSMII
mmetsp:Transcript_1524/g.3400  ORF Transcript_1524/g.3400 Transcript_1524/m.3400 type:complete len:742 (+) Transcript_1524:11-2236(+)